MRVWLVELELAEGAIGRLTHHEVLPRGVNVTEAGCSGLVSKSAPPPADWKATVVTRCATSVMYTAAARASPLASAVAEPAPRVLPSRRSTEPGTPAHAPMRAATLPFPVQAGSAGG